MANRLIGMSALFVCLTITLFGLVNMIGAQRTEAKGNSAEEIAARAAKAVEIEAKRSEDRTDYEWRTLSRAYADSLLQESDGAKVMGADEVHDILKKLSETKGHANPSEYFPYDLGLLLSLRLYGNCDANNYMVTLAGMNVRVRRYASLQKYVIDCLQKYLKECRYEEVFEQEIGHLNQNGRGQWNSAMYPTLGSYLAVEFAQQPLMEELVWATSLVRGISRFESTSKIECAKRNPRRSLANWLTKSKLNYPELYKIVNAYLVTYANDCGLEQGFRRALGDSGGKVLDGGNSLLADYIGDELWKQIRSKMWLHVAPEVLFALDLVDELTGLSQPIDESKCTGRYTEKLRSNIEHCQAEGMTKLHKFITDASINYSKGCEELFKQKLAEFKASEADKWSSVSGLKDCVESKEIRSVHREQIEFMVAKMRKVRKSDLNADTCFGSAELKSSCEAFLKHMDGSMLPLSFNEAAKQDNDNKNAFKSIYYCAIASNQINDFPWNSLVWLVA